MNEEYMHINQQRWDEMVGVHAKSAFYDVASFKAGRNSLAPLESEELGNVAGKALLHLQCHFGMDTLSWARLGAKVTGVDYSEKAIALAQSLAKELAIDAHFVRANIYDLPDETLIPGTFDIVYTALGVLGWLPDLKHWGKVIAHSLKPGGTFYILEGHPFMLTLDEHSSDLKVAYPYFSSEALQFDAEHSYADSETVLTNKTEYSWNHSLSDIFNALLSEGLSIDFFHEFPFCGWQYFSDMETGEDGWSRLKDEKMRQRVPLMFSLKATKK